MPSISSSDTLEDVGKTFVDLIGIALDNKGMSKRELSLTLGHDSAQISKWFGGSERFPANALKNTLKHLTVHGAEADEINSAYSVDVAIREFRSYLNNKKCRTLFVDEIGADVSILSEILISQSIVCSSEIMSISNTERLTYLADFIAEAQQLCRWIVGCSQNDYAPFISERNVMSHMRYPNNRFIGSILEYCIDSSLDGLKKRIVQEITLGLAQVKRDKTIGSYIHQHLVHLSTRHNIDGFDDEIKKAMASSNLHLKRMAMFGSAYRIGGETQAECIIYEMDRSIEFSNLVTAFDCMHYGDVGCDDMYVSKCLGSVDLTMKMIGNSLEQDTSPAVRNLCTRKIMCIVGRLEVGCLISPPVNEILQNEYRYRSEISDNSETAKKYADFYERLMKKAS